MALRPTLTVAPLAVFLIVSACSGNGSAAPSQAVPVSPSSSVSFPGATVSPEDAKKDSRVAKKAVYVISNIRRAIGKVNAAPPGKAPSAMRAASPTFQGVGDRLKQLSVQAKASKLTLALAEAADGAWLMADGASTLNTQKLNAGAVQVDKTLDVIIDSSDASRGNGVNMGDFEYRRFTGKTTCIPSDARFVRCAAFVEFEWPG